MSRPTRHEARRRALELLYEADVLGRPLDAVLRAAHEGDDPPDPFTVSLVEGVAARRDELDRAIAAAARGWRLQRMPILDRNLLRLGLHEIAHEPDVPASVAIDEAVELARSLSTDDSGRFVNGVLGRLAREQGDGADDATDDVPAADDRGAAPRGADGPASA